MSTQLEHVPVPLPDPSAYGYAHAVRTGPFLAIAGQCGMDDADQVVSPVFADQARRVLERMEAVVAAAGGTRADICAMTVFVTDIRYGPEFTAVRREFFGGERFPTSALVAVTALMPPGALVEAQGWAYLPEHTA